MTIVDGRPTFGPSDFARGPKGPNVVESDVGFLDAISGPAWRRQNVIANLFNGDVASYDEIDVADRVDVWGQIEGTKYEPHFDSFASLVTGEQVGQMKRRIDQEDEDRELLSEAGIGGFFAEGIASVVDLPTLFPVGAAVIGARAGLGIIKVGARTGLAAGTEAAVVEGVLQQRQETRSAFESSAAIGGSVILGGILGTGMAAVLGRSIEGREAFKAVSRAIEEGEDKFGNPGDLGAAAPVVPELTDFDLPTAGARAVHASTPSGLSFTDRFAKSSSAVARRIGALLLGNEYAIRGQIRLGIGPAAEVFAGLNDDRARVVIASVFKSDYKAYRKAAAGGNTPILTDRQFRDRVSAAMRRGDADPLYPEIAVAATKLRENVIIPMRDQAIEIGLLPEGVTVDTAVSYFTRMWDANKVVARSDVFLARLTDHFSNGLRTGAFRQQDAAQNRLSSLENELFDLTDEALESGNFDAQTITQFLGEQGPINKRIAELRRETRSLPKRPFGATIRALGGIDPEGAAASELHALGVTSKNSPGLFKKGGLKDVDAIDAEGDPELALLIGVESETPQFFSRQAVLDALADEVQGKARRTVGDQAALDEIEALVEMLEKGRRLIDEKAPGRLGELARVKVLKAKILKAQEVTREAAIKAEFTADEIATFSRSAAEDVMRQLTDPNVSPTDLLNITVTTRGPLNERTLNVRDVDFEDFLINDAEQVLNRYARVMSAETALTKRFGRADMADQIDEINADYARLRDELTTPKARTKLERERRRVIESLKAARDQVRGNYLAAERASGRYRAVQGALTFNYIRALGDVVKSSLPDVFKLSMTNGVRNVWADALIPLVTNTGAAKAARAQIAEVSGIAEVLLNSRMMRIADITDPHAMRTPIENTLNLMASKASLFSGIMHWNQFLKETAGVLSMNRLRRIDLNKISQRDDRFLRRIKLTPANLERIQGEMKLHGQDLGGHFVPNARLWKDDISELFGAVIRADADTVIVTPGIGDKVPLAEKAWWMKPALQFKAFALAAHRKSLIVGLQEDQGRFLSNAALSVSMGMFVYWLKAQSREKGNLSDNPGVWLAEGIDRSAMLPIYMEINNMAERIGAPGVYYGLGSVFGEAPERASRFQVRSVAGSVLGPTFGLLTDTLTVGSAALKGEVGTSDIKAGRRLMPYGNHPGMKEFLNLWAVPELQAAVK